ncbi:hypothetical protein [Phenylobacterium kunshanense]|uniref:Uncharacterized protein n=1 Tax=Phenylobacterium kunshanense TaxID=1445034 RepID=A0A328BB85_9CAUL|nr:hypothetical protein [Phenylobacterium kunshanense]RAK62994.1 hypothetical protein DJ019_17105 [Phenylobacterium kunshanense]
MTDHDPFAAGGDDARLDEAQFVETDGLQPEPETFELEVDGEIHALPASLKGAFLRQADYTRKTQELAEGRRALEAERQALSDHRRGLDGEASDRATLAALDRHLDEFEGLDWELLAHEEPRRAQALWETFQETEALRERFAYALAHHDQQRALEAARESAAAMAATGAKLREEIEGWSPEVAAKLVEYGQAFGVTLDELAQMADPRLWKVLHRAWRADQAGQGDAEAAARELRPAVTVGGGGSGAGGVRDELGTREWMRRRGEQLARGR